MSKKNQELFRSSFESMYRTGPRSATTAKSLQPTMESVHRADSSVFDGADHQGFGLANADADEYAIQRPIREWFGKDGINTGTIGAHPDFEYLDGTDDIRSHHITTVFIDIKNSTRLSLRYDLRQVRKIKNTILRAASETVRALDGHVHRFMGDALMAYFGGVNQDRESACMAAINCAAMLRLLMDESIGPGLQKQGIDPSDIGFRVGIDYGGDDEVLWSSYGYTDVSEVTATSFFVDAAAKLQSMASKDSAMLGGNLVRHLDFPDSLTGQKTEMREGKPVPVPYLRPNYALANGDSHNYEIHELKFKEFARLLPIPLDMRQGLVNGAKAHSGIQFQAYSQDTHLYNEYKSLSRCVSKGTAVMFQIFIEAHALDGLRLPLRGEWVRKNHGQQAADANMSKDERGSFEIRPNATNRGREPTKYKWTRNAEFRGIHTMEVEIYDTQDTLLFSDIIGVHIR
ncbi:Adenylate cyclase, class 3 [Collimonas sp. OK607]|uniref:nucleotide-binding domain-containing protein n=1 Tax=Collimonas sp. OK607 TaxID=1798194 RepID=UPI0008EBB2EA|nr:adenylate/guanylate cyclase domain-containing protein [Collimonas sp. OK607]SFB35425.1 Adenylate cyclase, class 3 [Collimonas sp. OK607]